MNSPLPHYGLDVPIQGVAPELNLTKYHKPLIKLAMQKMKPKLRLKRPTTTRTKRHHRTQYY